MTTKLPHLHLVETKRLMMKYIHSNIVIVARENYSYSKYIASYFEVPQKILIIIIITSVALLLMRNANTAQENESF